MIRKIHFNQFRKFTDVDIEFIDRINFIAGANGTCKTTLLHVVSNSFKAVNNNDERFKEEAISIFTALNSINSGLNTKIEKLQRESNKYNNNDYKGVAFNVEYSNQKKLDFRRHNSNETNRYCVKPKYPKGSSESLPSTPVIYLSLSRLLPYGQITNDDDVKKLKKYLPNNYQDELNKLYEDFTSYKINNSSQQEEIKGIKKKANFETDKKYIDSNTISDGEDNLYIILTALISLKYYYDSVKDGEDKSSILLIDEIDATLHPKFQDKLLKVLCEYSSAYKIQVIATTHSLFLLKESLENKDVNVVYLEDLISTVKPLKDISYEKIEAYLQNEINKPIRSAKIPVFTEDDEARIFIDEIFDYFIEKNKDFANIKNILHMPNIKIGCENLKTIFQDDDVLKYNLRSICILDGDIAPNKKYILNHIILLPGGASPEEIAFTHIYKIVKDDLDTFWDLPDITRIGYYKCYVNENIIKEIEKIYEIKKNKADKEDKKESIKGAIRQGNKKLFNDHKEFFKVVFAHWIEEEENQEAVKQFAKDLKIVYMKVCSLHGISTDTFKFEIF